MKICPRCSELFTDDASFCPHDGVSLETRTDKMLGRVIAARYRLVKRLGHGGMSVVYLARHELIARMSAIKILRPELSLVAEHRERFLREARAVNRINHANIVEITDVGESEGLAYLVMEYVDGESLLSHIQRSPLPWDRAARIGMSVAGALARCHQTGVIHRDLKPENILLVRTEREGEDKVKLTDFGIAKVMGEASLTMGEQLFGTPGYIAPEYVNGLPIDGRADLYSLAVVVYEMITGQLPFEGRGQADLLLKPLTSAPIPPSKRVEGLPPELESLILRSLSRERDMRPHDAFAFQDALADVLRRYGSGSRRSVTGRESLVSRISSTGIPAAGGGAAARDEMHTIAGGNPETDEIGKLVTSELSSRWAGALTELENAIAIARRDGHVKAANHAAEMALVAGEMIPRVERAAKRASEQQAKVDLLEVRGREFRANLGHALDTLVHDRSRERAHLDALRARKKALVEAIDSGALAPLSSVDGSDPRAFEIESLHAEERRAASVVEDITFQVEALQKRLDAENESFERELVEATGALEGSLSALRRLTSELIRTIDDGVALLQHDDAPGGGAGAGAAPS